MDVWENALFFIHKSYCLATLWYRIQILVANDSVSKGIAFAHNVQTAQSSVFRPMISRSSYPHSPQHRRANKISRCPPLVVGQTSSIHTSRPSSSGFTTPASSRIGGYPVPLLSLVVPSAGSTIPASSRIGGSPMPLLSLTVSSAASMRPASSRIGGVPDSHQSVLQLL